MLEKKLGGCIKLIVVKGNSGKQYHDIFETLYFQYNKERLRTSFQNNPNYTALLSMIDFGSLQSGKASNDSCTESFCSEFIEIL